MYQYESRYQNLERRNRAIIEMFNGFPRRCPETNMRYDVRSMYELVAERFYLSVDQVERIVSGRAEPKQRPEDQDYPTLF